MEEEKKEKEIFTVYYNRETGWIQENGPWLEPHTDESGSFTVDQEEWDRICGCPGGKRWKYDGTKAILVDFVDDANRDLYLSGELYSCLGYLSKTDYVITKINEAMIYGTAEEANKLKEKYRSILEERSIQRQRAREIEAEMQKFGLQVEW